DKDGEVSYWEVANDNFSTATGTSAPNTPNNQAMIDNRWTRKEYMQGLIETTLDQEQVDARILEQITPNLITQDVVEHADVFLPSATTDFSGVVGTPTHYTQEITITDPQASPNEQGAITFIHTMRAIGAVGAREPLMTFQITQRGAVLFNGRFRDPSDQVMGAFNGYLNEPFQVVEQIVWGTDTPSDHFRGELKQIKSARSGVLFNKLQEAIANATQEQFNLLTHDVEALQTLANGFTPALASIADEVQTNAQGISDNRDFAQATRGLLQTDVMRAVRSATIVPTDTPVIAATPLNTELGGGNNFAEQIKDKDIGTATQFITRFTDPHQVLQYGAGRVADVFNGRFRVFDLIPEADAFDTDTPKFLTNTAGQGTNTRPLEIPLGDNQDPKHPLDSTRTLATGYPVAGENKAFSNFSLQGYVRVNTTNYPISALALEPFTGQTQTRVLPNVIGVSLVAIDRGTGVEVQIRHANGGSVNNQPTNNARLFLEVGYVETITTPAVARGQEAIDMGAFTGQEVIAIDVGEAGTDAVKTAKIVLPDRILDTGYFLNEAHRTGFADDNPAFDILISEPETALTSEIMGRLDGADEFLGLFERTNHHEDELDFGRVLVGRTPAGDRVVLGTDGTAIVEATSTITFTDNAEIVGAHPEFGGGMRIETFTRLLTGAAIANGAHTIPVPTGNNITYHGWSAEVITANATAAETTIRGGVNTGEGGNESLDLA
ncbi:MAG: hypothetical protein K8953_09055, partial [Proteobacteria bacterium]|nr:hypothetical protein [Pseudomonadota bacterium]